MLCLPVRDQEGQMRVKGQRLRGTEESWHRLQPAVECGHDSMTLTVKRRQAAQLLLDRGDADSLFSLSYSLQLWLGLWGHIHSCVKLSFFPSFLHCLPIERAIIFSGTHFSKHFWTVEWSVCVGMYLCLSKRVIGSPLATATSVWVLCTDHLERPQSRGSVRRLPRHTRGTGSEECTLVFLSYTVGRKAHVLVCSCGFNVTSAIPHKSFLVGLGRKLFSDLNWDYDSSVMVTPSKTQ